eukprot:gene27058-33289_t
MESLSAKSNIFRICNIRTLIVANLVMFTLHGITSRYIESTRAYSVDKQIVQEKLPNYSTRSIRPAHEEINAMIDSDMSVRNKRRREHTQPRAIKKIPATEARHGFSSFFEEEAAQAMSNARQKERSKLRAGRHENHHAAQLQQKDIDRATEPIEEPRTCVGPYCTPRGVLLPLANNGKDRAEVAVEDESICMGKSFHRASLQRLPLRLPLTFGEPKVTLTAEDILVK